MADSTLVDGMQRLLDDFIDSTPWKTGMPLHISDRTSFNNTHIEYVLVHTTIHLPPVLFLCLSLSLCVYIPLHIELIKIYSLFEMPIEITNLFAISIKCTNIKDYQWISNTNPNNTRTRSKKRFIFHQREVQRCSVSLTLVHRHPGQTLN